MGKSCIRNAIGRLSQLKDITITEDAINVQTNADIASNNIILNTLEDSGLACNVFSEEETSIVKINGGDENVTIVIDPIDNTHLYLRGEIPFCSVALMFLIQGIPKYSFIGDISTGDIYYCNEKHAYKNDELLSVPSDTPGRDIILGWAPYKMRMERLITNLIDLTENDYYLYNFGGQLQAVKIATGHYDAYVEVRAETLNEFCAAIIVERAGGWVTTIQGKNIEYIPGKLQTLLIARNKKIHEDILKRLEGRD